MITATIARNNRQTLNNIGYEKSYNYAEVSILGAVETIGRPDFELSSLTSDSVQAEIGADDCREVSSAKYVCTYLQEDENRTTVMSVAEDKSVTDYHLSPDEYFDIVLFNSPIDAGYKGALTIKWTEEIDVELELIYLDSSDRLRSSVDIVNANGVFQTAGRPGGGFISGNISVVDGSEITLDLGNLNATEVGNSPKLRYLRVKPITKTRGTAVNIRALVPNNFPNQVRTITAFSYINDAIDSSAPSVVTVLPLSPPLPNPLNYAVNLHSVKQKFCGDFIPNQPEQCDDGNSINTDACLNNCRNAICGDLVVRTGVEQCDDGNTTNTDACTNACRNAVCGDAIVRAGVEQCDDGNTNNKDACRNNCRNARCGDGIVRTGVEDCDDGNTSNGDGCSSTCKTESSGGGGCKQTGGACCVGGTLNCDYCSSQSTCSYGDTYCGNSPGDNRRKCGSYQTEAVPCCLSY